MFLTDTDAGAIAGRVAAIERRTGAEVVIAIVGRADRYPEARWKAFALGVAFSAFAAVLADALQPAWTGAHPLLPAVVAILGVGIANALAAHFVPAYARAYVRHNRAEAEVRQYAESTFLARGLFASPGRRTVLIVVALFERVVVVHADEGVAARVPASDWDRVVEPIVAGLSAGDRAGAIGAGLTTIEAVLSAHGFTGTGEGRNALPDRPLEEEG